MEYKELVKKTKELKRPNFRVGDTVYNLGYGKGTVVDVDMKERFPITVAFENGTESYTNEGCVYSFTAPELFFTPPVPGETPTGAQVKLEIGVIVTADGMPEVTATVKGFKESVDATQYALALDEAMSALW